MRILFKTSFILLFLGLISHTNGQKPGIREKYNFNADWKMKVDDTPGNEKINIKDNDWQVVTLPHAFNEDDAFKKPIQDLTTGIVWYRKYFKLPKGSNNKKIFIEFEGIRHGGEFYLNGKSIGKSENGIMAFGFDISKNIKFDSINVLAAKIDNRWNYHEQATESPFQWNDKNFYANYGGINKNVYIHITNQIYQTLPLFSSLGTTGTYVYPSAINVPERSALITVESQVKNETDKPQQVNYEVEVTDNEGRKIASFQSDPQLIKSGELTTLSAKSRINDLHFWSWGYGYLYNIYSKLKIDNQVVDIVKTTTGFS